MYYIPVMFVPSLASNPGASQDPVHDALAQC
jgi:hypothetical protein